MNEGYKPIQRFTPYCSDEWSPYMAEDSEGEWISFVDHIRVLASLTKAENSQIIESLDLIQDELTGILKRMCSKKLDCVCCSDNRNAGHPHCSSCGKLLNDPN